MTAERNQPVAVRPQVLPSEYTQEMRMPAGTPFGVGALGVMRYAAIRRVLEEYERARIAKARAHEAEAAEADALVGREQARERLRNIGMIREGEANRIRNLYNDAEDAAEIVKLTRRLEKLELEDKIAVTQARLDARKGPAAEGGKRDEHAEFVAAIGRIPALVQAARAAKANIGAEGGEPSPADEDIKEQIDAMVQSWVAKQTEARIL